VQLLLEKGANIGAGDEWISLHQAASNRHGTIVQLLLEKGANVEAKAKNGETALHQAARNGHRAVMLLL
jgi:ankyrin repeat protein